MLSNTYLEMSSKSTVDQIKHYQKDIERCPNNSERMIRCIQRLYILPIKVEHLQETGIGRSVNSLRKYKGEVGDAAKALVAKWKAMVAAEESTECCNDEMLNKRQDPQSSPVLPVKIDRKSEKPKEKSYSKEHTNRHSSNYQSHSSDKQQNNLSSSKSNDKKFSSNSKIPESLSSSSKHSSSIHDISVKAHKMHNDKKRKPEVTGSPPREKKYKSHHVHSKSKSTSSLKAKKAESDIESDSSRNSNSDISDRSSEGLNSSGEESVVGSNKQPDSGSDSENDFSNDRKSKHKSSHYNYKHSNHLKDPSGDFQIKTWENDKTKRKDKNKENRNHNKNNEKQSSKRNLSPDIKELIKENEKKVKKETTEDLASPKSMPPPNKNIKLETNEDGSIDSGSGASFADALMGINDYSGKKKSKKHSGSGSSSQKAPSKSSSKVSSPTMSSSREEEKKSIKLPKASSSKPKTIDQLVEPPGLLSKKVKLEALDLDFSSTLPEINPNYKPLPHVPERSRQVKQISDEDHMFTLMSQKNQRTKVYSGNKVSQTSIPSLFNMCIQLLYDNIDAVEYTGGVPFQLLKPLLEKLNADQLYVLEHFNPYLIEDTDDLWKFHCSKEFRNQKRQDMESWRELYVRCMDERERKLKALTANITQSMAKSTPVRQAKLAYVDAVVKPPRNIARKQAKFGTATATSVSKNPTKQEIVSKAIIGGNTPGVTAKDTVPIPPSVVRSAAHHPTPAIVKKKKAPLMQKALQVMKGTRYKR